MGPDKLAYSVLSVPMWAFAYPTWRTFCCSPKLPQLFPMHRSQYSALYSVHSPPIHTKELMEIPFTSWVCVAIRNVACLSCCYHHCWNASPSTSLCSHPLIGPQKCPASIKECHWVPFFSVQFFNDSSASYTLSCQTSFHQTTPLLPSVTWQQNVTEYW